MFIMIFGNIKEHMSLHAKARPGKLLHEGLDIKKLRASRSVFS